MRRDDSIDVAAAWLLDEKRTYSGHRQHDVGDPGCVKALQAIIRAKQKNRDSGLSDSLMREWHSGRINLAPDQPAEWFSRGQDP